VTEKKSAQKQSQAKSGKKKDEKEDSDPLPILTQAFEMAVGQDGWAPLAGMGNALYQLDPGFDPRTYGHKQLSRMITSLKDKFEMRTQNLDGTSILYVKMKE
jgi:Fe-S-cluster formation regulator IscX/YfhJ